MMKLKELKETKMEGLFDLPLNIKRDEKLESLLKRAIARTKVTRTKRGLPYYNIRTKNCTYIVIKQNRYKSSIWAKLAQAGNSVWQVITIQNGKKRYIGVIINKKYYSYENK